MAKIIKFNKDNENVLKLIDSVRKEAEVNDIDNMIILSKLKSGEVLMGVTKNISWASKIELISHLKVEIINEMIKQNYITN